MAPTEIDSREDEASTSNMAIAMAADTGYLLPTLVAVDSILASSASGHTLDFYLIVPDEGRPLFEESLGQVFSHYPSGHLHFLSVGQEFDDAQLNVSHITTPTYYRLALPRLLPEVDRCLYIDGDVVVRDDLFPIVQALTDQDLLAGVKAAGYYWPEKTREWNRDRLDIPEFTDYLNAGVIAMNLKLMRELDCEAAFTSLLDVGYASQDQDIINKVCHGRIVSLPPRFNLMTKYHPESEDAFGSTPCLGECWTEDEWSEACQNPAVVHFADSNKPWQTDQMDCAELWWEAAENAGEHNDALRAALPLMRRTATVLAKNKYVAQEKIAECDRLKKSLSEERESRQRVAAERDSLATDKSRLTGERDKLSVELNNANKSIEKLTKELGTKKTQLATANRTIERLYASRSWKIGHAITAPVRLLRRLLARLR